MKTGRLKVIIASQTEHNKSIVSNSRSGLRSMKVLRGEPTYSEVLRVAEVIGNVYEQLFQVLAVITGR